MKGIENNSSFNNDDDDDGPVYDCPPPPYYEAYEDLALLDPGNGLPLPPSSSSSSFSSHAVSSSPSSAPFFRTDPADHLDFRPPFTAVSTASLSLTNTHPSDQTLAFKIKIKSGMGHAAKPNAGVLGPGASTKIQISSKPLPTNPPAGFDPNHKVLIQAILVPDHVARIPARDSAAHDAHIAKLWAVAESDKDAKLVAEKKLRCRYLVAGSASAALDDKHPTATNQLLHVSPTGELPFHRPPTTAPANTTTPIHAVLRLTNVHPSPARAVAFKIKTTAPTRAFARPNRGVVLPGESVTVVCGWAPGPQQRTTEGRDRFLVECAAVPEGMAGDGVGDVWAHVERGGLLGEGEKGASARVERTRLRCVG